MGSTHLIECLLCVRLELGKLHENVSGIVLDNVPGILQSNDERQFPSPLCHDEDPL